VSYKTWKDSGPFIDYLVAERTTKSGNLERTQRETERDKGQKKIITSNTLFRGFSGIKLASIKHATYTWSSLQATVIVVVGSSQQPFRYKV
jgi:hypothetical protein